MRRTEAGLAQRRARGLGVVGDQRQLGIAGPVVRRQQGAGQPRRATHHVAHDGLAVDGLRDGAAHRGVTQPRVVEIEAQVGEIGAARALHADARLVPQVVHQLRRQVVLQQIDLATQQLQHPHRGVGDAHEGQRLAVAHALQLQAAGIGPGAEAERPATQRLAAEDMPSGHLLRRQDADDQIGGKQHVGTGEMEVEGVIVDHLDGRDQGQRGTVRRGIGRVENEIVGGLDIMRGEPAAVVELATLLAEAKAVVDGRQPLPVRQRRRRHQARVEIHQPRIEQAVDACGGGIGGETRVQGHRRTGEAEAQHLVGRARAAAEQQRGQQQDKTTNPYRDG